MDLATETEHWLDAHWDPALTVREWWRLLFEAGLSHPTWPVGLGGRGLGAAPARQIAQALGRRNVVAPPAGNLAAALAAPTLLTHGSESQRLDLVAPIALGEAAWCQLFSEPGAGSDLAGVDTRARRDGDEWVVDGQKVWNSGADVSDFGMLLARTDPEVPKHAGLTWFVLEMDQSGVEVRPLRTMNGTAPFCEVFLTSARVRADGIVGGLGEGWNVARTTLAAERAMVAGGTPGGLVPARSGRRGDLDRTCAEVIERTRRAEAARAGAVRAGAIPATRMVHLARDHAVADHPVTRQALAAYSSQVRVNGWTMRRSAAARGALSGADGSIAKLSTAEICQRSADLSYRVAGAQGMLSGHDDAMGGELNRVALASPGNRIGGGTDEIQRTVLGERALGLPREPGEDRHQPWRTERSPRPSPTPGAAHARPAE